MLTTKQRAYVKSLAHNLDCVFQIGKNGVTPELTQAIDDYIRANELIKINVLNSCETDIKDVAEMLSSRTHSEVVQIIGKKLVLYSPSKTKPVIELPKVKNKDA